MTFRPAARTGSPAGTVRRRSSPAAINIQRLCIERLLSRSFSPNGMLAPPLASSCNGNITGCTLVPYQLDSSRLLLLVPYYLSEGRTIYQVGTALGEPACVVKG